MADTNLTRNLRDGKITLIDGTAVTPEELEITVDEGNLHFEVPREFIEIDDRGVLDHVRTGMEVSIPVSFAVKFKEWKASTGASPSPADVLYKVGEAAAWESVAQDGEPYALDLAFEIVNPDANGEKETLTFTKFRARNVTFDEADEYNTLAVDGFAYITAPASERAVQA